MLGFSALAMPAASFAAGINLYNGGLGQIAGDMQTFGVAVCNGGPKAVSQSAPVSVAVGGQTAYIVSMFPIKAGVCAYSYLTYGQLGMASGGTYSVTVTIDPARTVITNANNQAVYKVAVPAVKVSAAAPAVAGKEETANANAQSGNFFNMLGGWLSDLFGGK